MSLESELAAIIRAEVRRVLTEAEVPLPPPGPVLMSVEEYAARLNVSESKVYAMVRSGEVPSQHVGRRVLVVVKPEE